MLIILLFLPSLLFANYLENLLRVATVKELQAAHDAGADFTVRFDDMETAYGWSDSESTSTPARKIRRPL